MPERLPNQDELITPSQLPEVTQETIDTAGFQDVPLAIDNYVENIHARMDDTSSPAVQTSLEKELERAELATDWSIKWFENNKKRTEAFQGSETFKQFLDRTQMEETHPAVLEQIDKVSTFVYSGAYDKFMGDAIRTRLQKEALETTSLNATAKRVEQPAPDPTFEIKQQAEKQQAIDEAREKLERARGIEVFDDIVKFAKGKTHLSSDLQRGYTSYGDAKNKNSHREDLPNSVIQKAEAGLDMHNWRGRLDEAVGFTDVVEIEKREETIPRVEKGRFGRTKSVPEKIMVSVPGSEHPVLMRNEQTGQDEPTVRFQYQFKYGNTTMRAAQMGELPRYRAYDGRDGQYIKLGVDLPKSLADKLQSQVRQEPSSVRLLAEKLFLKNSGGRLESQRWRGEDGHSPVKPPYEDLPSDWSIAIITGVRGVNNSLDYHVDHVPAKQ